MNRYQIEKLVDGIAEQIIPKVFPDKESATKIAEMLTELAQLNGADYIEFRAIPEQFENTIH